jgi:TRAP-type C4-dicarboxylate transport system permease small subunit
VGGLHGAEPGPEPGPPGPGSGSVIDRIVTGGMILAGLMLVYLLSSMTVGIVSRAVFTRPMAWVVELTGPALVGMTFLAAAAVAREDDHVRLAILDEYLSDRALRRLGRVSTVIEVIVIAGLLYATSIQWWADLQSGTLASGFLRVERWRVTAVVPLGVLLYLLFLLRALVRGRQLASGVSGSGPRQGSAP